MPFLGWVDYESPLNAILGQDVVGTSTTDLLQYDEVEKGLNEVSEGA
jgi:hypothetical protein